MSSPYVVHSKRSPYDVYIGRPGPWGNPYVIGRDGTREEVITQYEAYLRGNQGLRARLPELRGKVLGCWCAPQPCHGDVLARLANERRRLLVTGSQDWDDFAVVRRALKKLWDFDPDILLVSGACPRGADLLCETIWDEYLGGATERHLADWYASGSFDRAVGFRRSEKMADLGAWGCLAFGLPCERVACRGKPADPGWPFHVTHGTKHCSRYAETRGIPVKRYTPILLE